MLNRRQFIKSISWVLAAVSLPFQFLKLPSVQAQIVTGDSYIEKWVDDSARQMRASLEAVTAEFWDGKGWCPLTITRNEPGILEWEDHPLPSGFRLLWPKPVTYRINFG